MTALRLSILAGLLACFAAGAVWAEDGVLVVRVTYLDKKSLARVRIGVGKEGSTERTGADGQARLRLAAGVREEQEVALQVVPLAHDEGPWVFISPWNRRARVPRFTSSDTVAVVLAKKADREALLGNSDGRKAVEQSILSELGRLRQARSEVREEQRRAVLQAQAAAYGLKPEEVDAAIHAAAEKSPDLTEQGLATLYERNYPVASELLGKALAKNEEAERQAEEKVADAAFFYGESRYEEGRYREAVAAFRKSVARREEDAATLNGLGMALVAAGESAEAEVTLRRALDAARQNDPSLAGYVQGNLAVVLEERGDYAGARQLGEQVLEARRRQWGPDHGATLAAQGNLAATLVAAGELAPARLFQEQVLKADRRRLGEDHLDTARALGNLAETLRLQGELAPARQLQEQALGTYRRHLPAEHPSTLTAMNNLAETLRAQGELAPARQLEEQVVESRRRQLGADHPATARAMGNLAETLRRQGELPRARQLQEEALAADRRLLGADHPATLTAMDNLAGTLADQGDLAAARQLREPAVESLRRQLGAEHPRTIKAMNNLAGTLAAQGDLAQARPLEEQVLASSRRLWGAEHPDTLLAASNLADTLRALGDLPAARQLQEQVLDSLRRRAGPDPPDTLAALNDLIATENAQGDLQAARPLLEQLVEARRRLSGARHSDTSFAEWNLLVVRYKLGDSTGVLELKKSLAWLLEADEAQLSAPQRQIRQALQKLQPPP